MKVPALAPHWKPRAERSLVLPAVLGLVDRLRRPIEAAGVDFRRFRVVLELMLRLDARGVTVGDEGALSGGFLILAAFAWLFGLPAGILAFFRPEPALWMAAVQATSMGFVAMAMLLQYGPMLLDRTDIEVVAPRPVGDRTLFAARIAHVLVYTGVLSACASFWPLILGPFGYPAWAVLTLVPLSSALSTLLSVGCIAGFYVLVLRLFGPARFQRLALGLQVGMAIILMGGGQILPRLVWDWSPVGTTLSEPVTRYLIPPLHFGSLFDLALGGNPRANLPLAALAVLLPVLAGLLALRLASRHFIAGIAGEIQTAERRIPGWRSGRFSRLGRICTRSAEERASYDLALSLSRRDRAFLLRALPQLIGFSCMALAMSLPLRRRAGGTDEILGGFALYFTAAILPGVLDMARYSEHAKARWILHALPVRRYGALLSGGIKAILLGTLLPAELALAAVILALVGITGLADIGLALEMVAAIILVGIPFFGLAIPFTSQPRSGEFAGRLMAIMFALMACAGAAAGLHFVAKSISLAQGSLMVLLVPVVVLLFRRLEHLNAAPPEL